VKLEVMFSRRRAVSSAVVAFMLLLWLATAVLAASPQLHRLLHSDASASNHECVVTLVQQHVLLWQSGAVTPAPAVEASAGLLFIAPDGRSQADDPRISPSRAPPPPGSMGGAVG
jgi:hypothetical protein